ncbi:MAG: hypothetical protein KBH61_03040 [Parabacteroides sp.]|jgi:hypothetical protein|nr:hypothetical protein [Parabacteroides sp.]
MKRVKLLFLLVALLFSVSAFSENALLFLTKVNFQDLRAGDDQPVPMTFNYSNKILKVSYDQALVGSTFTISTVEGQTLYSGFPQVSNGSFVIPVTLNSSDMYVLTIENSEGLLYTVFTLADL